MREIVAVIFNTNVKKGKQKPSHKLYPLSIDNKEVFTYEDAKANYEAAIKAGWIKDKLN